MAHPRIAAVAHIAVVAVLSILAAFFVAFNVVFSDAGTDAERAWSLVYVFAAYVVLGGISAFLPRADARVDAALIAVPAAILLSLYGARESGILVLILTVLVVAVGGALVGLLVAARVRGPRRSTS